MGVLPPDSSQSVYSLCSYLLLKYKQLSTPCAVLCPRCFPLMAADIFLSAVSKTQTARHPVMTRYVSESVHPGTVGRGESYTLASLTCLSSVILGCLRVQEGCIEFRDGTTVLFKELTVISKLSPTDPEQVRDICRQNCEGLSKSCVRFTEAYGSDEPISFAHLDPDIFAHYYCQNFSSSVGLNGDLSVERYSSRYKFSNTFRFSVLKHSTVALTLRLVSCWKKNLLPSIESLAG